ncbi:hypothetical protein PRK78_004033 [Emydomyces testavorans]|uniref:Uncharacterized protein n=1 Tax=Emydomyces testavorans TaxID=2070801 RepID=A0AAF0DKD1_9EURO|nr:hypothetical protein PRK78_004033 [Emydomyces testavorans]
MLDGSVSPRQQNAPVVVELMETRPSKKRTRDDEVGTEKCNTDLFAPDISNDHFVNRLPVYRGYAMETSEPSMVTVISPPTATKLCHGSRINLDIRPRLRPILGKKRRTVELKAGEIFGQIPYSPPSETTSKIVPSSRHSPPHVAHDSQHRQHADRPAPTPILTPCHICYRRPTMHFQLDAYADCELCGKRTCYICLRECEGPDCRAGVVNTSNNGLSDWDASGRKMCSWCAVEGVTDSGIDVVWCVDCVQRGENGCQDDAWMGG